MGAVAGAPTPLMRIVSRPVMALTRLVHRLDARGTENLPTSGPCIVVANHTHYLDPLIIGTPMVESGLSPSFVAKKELFAGILGMILRSMGQISVNRVKPQGSIEAMAQALDEGKCVVLFPEGTFTSDTNGWPMTPKTGVVRLSELRPDVPVIPVAHWGNERILHPITIKPDWKRIFTRSERVIVSFLPPLQWVGESHRDKANNMMLEIGRELAQIRKDLGRPAGEMPGVLKAWAKLPSRKDLHRGEVPEVYGP